MSRIFIGKKVKKDLDKMMKKVNIPSKVQKGIKKPHVIIVGKLAIHQIYVGAMEKKNSMESATIVVSMVIRKMNAKRNQNLRVSVTNVRNEDIRH